MQLSQQVDIVLEFMNKSKVSSSRYYKIIVNNEPFSFLRVANHPKENWKGFYYCLGNPNKVKLDEVIAWLKPQIITTLFGNLFKRSKPTRRKTKKNIRKFKDRTEGY